MVWGGGVTGIYDRAKTIIDTVMASQEQSETNLRVHVTGQTFHNILIVVVIIIIITSLGTDRHSVDNLIPLLCVFRGMSVCLSPA